MHFLLTNRFFYTFDLTFANLPRDNSASMAFRFDSGTVNKPTKTPQGFLRADATPTRCGVLSYRLADGSIRRELRHPDEVFKADSLATLNNAPLTDEHPNGAVTASNAKGLTVGYPCEPARPDGEHVRTAVLVTDAATIAKIEGKNTPPKRELSCGYHCDLDFTPGEYNGEAYDAVQRNIVYNHVALVTKGRAGPTAAIRLDADDNAIVEDDAEGSPLKKIKIDGVEFEVSESAASAFEKFEASQREQLTKLQARADSAEADSKKAQDALQVANDPKRISDAVAARLSLEKTAEKAGVKCDGLSDDDVKKAVVEKLQPALKLDGKDATYVATAFDIAVSKLDEQEKPKGAQPKINVTDVTNTDNQDLEARKAAAREKAQNAWKAKDGK